MNATRILPELQASLLCESVRQETNGNFLLVGVVSHIRAPQLPVVAMRLCVFNRWTSGVGRFQQSVRFVAPDATTVVCGGNAEFELRDPTHHATSVLVFGNAEFKTAGTYFIEVLVDEVMKLRAPLSVMIAPARQPAPAPIPENQPG